MFCFVFQLEKVVFFRCLFTFGAFSLWTGLRFIVVLPSPHGVSEHVLAAVAELQPAGSVGTPGDRVTPKKAAETELSMLL